jgi:antitoxin component YwqK of YwqJK toxin-antitoxin module
MKGILNNYFISVIASASLVCGSVYYYSDAIQNHIDETGMRQGSWVITGAMTKDSAYELGDTVEEGNFIDDKKVGTWNKYSPSGKLRSQITYENNRPIGAYIIYYENGIVEESGNWQRNKNTGEFKRNYSNGHPHQRFSFSDSGKRNGKQTYYHENGKLALLVELVNGKEAGVMRRFNENGELSEETHFNNGKYTPGSVSPPKEKPIEFTPPPVEITANSDIVATPEATKEDETNAAHQFNENGHNILYDQNNNISQSGYFKEGRLWNGKWFKYNVNGIALRVDIYRNGKFIGHGVLEQE